MFQTYAGYASAIDIWDDIWKLGKAERAQADGIMMETSDPRGNA